MICNNCHNKNDKDAKFCRVCGTLLNTENTYDNKHLKYSNKKSSTSLKFVVALLFVFYKRSRLKPSVKSNIKCRER